MDDPFDRVLETLASLRLPEEERELFELSDMDQTQLNALASHWEPLPASRRLELIRTLGSLARDHIELNFDRINQWALRDPEDMVRVTAIENLWESEDPALVAPLVRCLRQDSPGVRATAAAALGQFVYLGEVGQLSGTLLEDVENALLEAVRTDADPAVRRRALESAGYSSSSEVPPLIEAAYLGQDEEDRRAALRAMGRSADDRWKERVLSQLHSPSPFLRREAAAAAGELELREGTTQLIELLDDVDLAVHRAAVWSLGQLGGARARRALTALAESAEAGEEGTLLQDALDHLAFVDGALDLELLDVDGEEDEADLELLDVDGEEDEAD